MKLARALLLLLCLLFLAAPGCGITETDVESPPAASAAPPEETGPARTPDEGGVAGFYGQLLPGHLVL